MTTRSFTRAALLGVVVATLAAPASAFDLTGHWVGKWSCKGFDGATFKDANKTSILDITQSGAAIHARLEGAFLFNGAPIPDPTNPDKGEIVLLDCHTNAVFAVGDGDSEIVRAAVATKAATVKASFHGVSILENDVLPFGEQVQTCKYAYTRASTTDPGIGGCP